MEPGNFFEPQGVDDSLLYYNGANTLLLYYKNVFFQAQLSFMRVKREDYATLEYFVEAFIDTGSINAFGKNARGIDG